MVTKTADLKTELIKSEANTDISVADRAMGASKRLIPVRTRRFITTRELKSLQQTS